MNRELCSMPMGGGGLILAPGMPLGKPCYSACLHDLVCDFCCLGQTGVKNISCWKLGSKHKRQLCLSCMPLGEHVNL